MKNIEISDNKLFLISWSALITLVTGLVGGAIYIYSTNSMAQSNAVAIGHLRQGEEVQLKILRNLDTRTARIEGLLEGIYQKQSQERENGK